MSSLPYDILAAFYAFLLELIDLFLILWEIFCAYYNTGECDLFSGDWICDPYGPVYTNNSCNFIEAPQNCLRNGRPDTDFLYWRWKPNGCELLPFDPLKFINAMRNKSWAFIGDSIFRNHIQSMLCLLSKVNL